ncbi:response regulator transcription factor [Flavihumibacter sp. R14]|nr:response regulator transcription factor [Flavihumibacter soli]
MKKKIVVVENDRDICEIIFHILSEEGYETILCYTEKGAIDIIEMSMPDAILLDIIQPSEQGTALCRAIKAAETTRHIPVIVLSTYSKIAAVKQVCADEVVTKPFDITALLEVVKEQLAAA